MMWDLLGVGGEDVGGRDVWGRETIVCMKIEIENEYEIGVDGGPGNVLLI